MAENADGSYTFGECKWSISPVDKGLARQLAERADKSGLHAKKSYLVLFSSGGFKDSLTQPPILVDLKALYGITL